MKPVTEKLVTSMFQAQGTDGQTELVRQFAAQMTKEGLIIDGALITAVNLDRFIELLDRKPLAFWSFAMVKCAVAPHAHFGQSNVDKRMERFGRRCFPDYFRKAD